MHAWVAILRARSRQEVRWHRWYWVPALLIVASLVMMWIDGSVQAFMPLIGAVAGVTIGRPWVQARLERRRGDLLEWLLDARTPIEAG